LENPPKSEADFLVENPVRREAQFYTRPKAFFGETRREARLKENPVLRGACIFTSLFGKTRCKAWRT
jgi:hypothetical protein